METGEIDCTLRQYWLRGTNKFIPLGEKTELYTFVNTDINRYAC